MLTDTFEVLDKRFTQYALGNVHKEVLYTGSRWAEGPAYFPAGKYLIWSDIPNDRLLRYDETDGNVSVFLQPCRNHNGHTVDRHGRLVSCEHRGRCISRIEFDGTRTVLVSEFQGKRLNSPNDLVVKSDGTIWFSDPTYGIDSEYEGDKSPAELDGSYVYRFDPADGSLEAVATDFVKPNGLAFSPDESKLYIGDTGATHVEDGPRHIRIFDVGEGGKLSGGEVFATSTIGLFDGFRIDVDGNIWTSAGDGVHCITPEGDLIGKILTGEVVANVEFGGIKRNRLYICATTTLQAVYLNTSGVVSGR
ncbi:MAG TPA: SMP-30/gluconolactonase/LRE family protein [Afifellaceae bacterium]|nr:SMP-30/gluconolactonase/LRE family protein [Afifellaceae bacterium]